MLYLTLLLFAVLVIYAHIRARKKARNWQAVEGFGRNSEGHHVWQK